MGSVREMLQSEDVVLLDGGMGTLLLRAGLPPGASPEEWNASRPDVIRQVHAEYLGAGARILLTNTFGGSPFRLRGHGLDERTEELNRAGAELARDAADRIAGEGAAGTGAGASAEAPPPGAGTSPTAPPSSVLVAGSVGPSGEMMEPMGVLTPGAAEAGFAEQVRGLASGGVDLIWVETMSDLAEVRAAVLGARSVCDLPVAATMTFDAGGRTMMGTSPEEVVAALLELDVIALGANCGNGPDEVEEVIRAMAALDPPVPLIAKANAGIPTWVGGELVYDGTPEVMRDYAVRVRDAGARLIGGCCGTTPAHIRTMAQGLG